MSEENQVIEETVTEETPVTETPEKPIDPLDAAIAKAMSTEPAQDDGEPVAATAEEPTPSEPVSSEATPPENWSKEDKEAFARITDPVAKKLVLDQSAKLWSSHTKRMQEVANEVKPYKEAFSPFAAEMARHGMDEPTALKAVLRERAEFFTGMQRDPKAYLQQLAKQFNVSLDASADDQPADYTDPYVKQLESKLQQLQGKLDSTINNLESDNIRKANEAINSFAQAKDDKGEPKYPHFDTLKAQMGKLIAAGQAESLETAYHKALRLDDGLYKQETDRLLQAERERLEKQRKEDVEKAMKAKRNFNGTGPSRPAPKQVKTIDDAFKQAIQATKQAG